MPDSNAARLERRSRLSTAGKLNVTGLIAGAAGILVQVLGGVEEYPTVPPGLIILLVTAGLVALGSRWWWTVIIGVVVPLYIAVGGLVATPGWADLLGDPSRAGAFTGAVVQLLGLLLAIGAGIVAAGQRLRTRRRG